MSEFLTDSIKLTTNTKTMKVWLIINSALTGGKCRSYINTLPDEFVYLSRFSYEVVQCVRKIAFFICLAVVFFASTWLFS